MFIEAASMLSKEERLILTGAPDTEPFEGPSAFRLEPPGYMLHRWDNGRLVSHVAVLGDWPGPFPFFDADGKLID